MDAWESIAKANLNLGSCEAWWVVVGCDRLDLGLVPKFREAGRYVYIYICMCIYVCIYYIYIAIKLLNNIYIYIIIYIYTYVCFFF